MKLTNGVHLHIIQTEKFKDVGISIRFLSTLKEETASARSLLALMLCDRSAKYDTKKKMSDIQDLLYGASLHAQTVGYGKAQVLELRSRVVDPVYTNNEMELLREVFNFLREIIFHPLLIEETFTEAKNNLKAKLMRIQDDSSQYAISKGLKVAGKGTPLAISSLGELHILEKVTLDEVQSLHKQLLEEDRIDIIVSGNCDEQQIKGSIKELLPFSARDEQYETHYAVACKKQDEVIVEQREITQSSIFMLWNTSIDISDVRYYALRVANAMFGQYPTSMLFQEIREKHSLCYSISANLISFDGALGVTTGVDKKHEETAIALIKQQFKRLCDGDFSLELLEVSKIMIINSLNASKDAMNSLVAHTYQNAILHQDLQIDERIEAIKRVTQEDIQHVAQACRLQLTCIVTKGDVE